MSGITGHEKWLYRRALEEWGEEAQIDVLLEEMGELLVALSKRNREINGSSEEEIKDEIVDLQIALDQAKLIFFEREMEFIEMKRGSMMYLKDLLEGRIEP